MCLSDQMPVLRQSSRNLGKSVANIQSKKFLSAFDGLIREYAANLNIVRRIKADMKIKIMNFLFKIVLNTWLTLIDF